MRLSTSEWLALLMDSGRRHILEDLRRDGFHVSQIPAEVVGVVDAHIAVARADVATLRPAATEPDTGLVSMQKVADQVGRSRRTVERRIRDRSVDTVKQGGRTFVHRDDVDRLRDTDE